MRTRLVAPCNLGQFPPSSQLSSQPRAGLRARRLPSRGVPQLANYPQPTSYRHGDGDGDDDDDDQRNG